MINKKGQVEIGVVVIAFLVIIFIFMVSTGVFLNPFNTHNYILSFDPNKEEVSTYQDITFDFRITNPMKSPETLKVNLSYNESSWRINDYNYNQNGGLTYEDVLKEKILSGKISVEQIRYKSKVGNNYTFTLNIYDAKQELVDSMDTLITIK